MNENVSNIQNYITNTRQVLSQQHIVHTQLTGAHKPLNTTADRPATTTLPTTIHKLRTLANNTVPQIRERLLRSRGVAKTRASEKAGEEKKTSTETLALVAIVHRNGRPRARNDGNGVGETERRVREKKRTTTLSGKGRKRCRRRKSGDEGWCCCCCGNMKETRASAASQQCRSCALAARCPPI